MRTARKACLITSAHQAFDTRIFHRQARSLANAGYDVVLLAPHYREESVHAVRVKPLAPGMGILRRVRTCVQAFRLARREAASAYHFHDLELIPVGIMLKLATRAKIIYDVHEDYAKAIEGKALRPALLRHGLARLVGWGERWASRLFFDAVVTAGEDISGSFGKQKPVTVRNYPKLETISDTGKEARGDGYTLVYAGGVSPARGVVEVIEALDLLSRSDVRLTLIGRFHSESFSQHVRSLRGYRHVDFLGWLEQEDMHKELAAGDVGVYCPHPAPNYLPLRSNKIFEYMAAGLPIVTADFPSWKRVIDAERVGITVNPQDTTAIAEAIQYLLEHPELRHEMGERGRAAIRARYNWENEAVKLLHVYSRLMVDGAKERYS